MPGYHAVEPPHPLENLYNCQWPTIKVVIADCTKGWRPSLHYPVQGYIELENTPVFGYLPGLMEPVKLGISTVELDFRFWQRCPLTRGSQHCDYNGSSPIRKPLTYSLETFIEFFPHEVISGKDGSPDKLRVNFIATVPCTMFHMTGYDAHRFFEFSARAWFWRPDFEDPTHTMYVAGPPSKKACAYMGPHARSHTLQISDTPRPPWEPPTFVPFKNRYMFL